MKKVRKARRANKGVRIQLSPAEIEASGGDLMEWLKKGAKAVKKGLQKASKIVGKERLRKGLTEGLKGVASFIPGASPFADKYARRAVDFAGDRLGFGIDGGCCQYCKGTGMMRVRGGAMDDPEYLDFVSSDHPVMSVQDSYLRPVGEYGSQVGFKRGGSFRAL